MSLRNTVVIIATGLIFAAVVYGGVLQDRARRKAYGPNTSIFSIVAAFRAMATKEMFYFVLLTLVTFAFAWSVIALDEAGYLPR